MKKIVFILGLVLYFIIPISAQDIPSLPIDPKIRIGELENGLTYYIRYNSLPKERADFYIAQKVGAVLEEDNQNGLAHFLEHMAFNGSKHFPGNQIIHYLESIGVKFGRNLNAYTSYDQTVYNISDVPILTTGAIDSCLQILHDWSGALLLEKDEIDKERGVIREEMRIYGGASWRMREKLMPQIMPGSQYAKRNVIGTEEVILNFKYELLDEFYKKWYRPDLQAIIIVGDINVDEIENKIKTIFSDIPKRVNPAERIYFLVEDNKDPLVGIASDKEATSTTLSINFKHNPLPRELRGTMAAFMTNYYNYIISLIMEERFQELLLQPNPPFTAAFMGNGSFQGAATKDALTGIAYIKDNDIERGMKALSREIERVNKYGFSPSEYDRAKANLLTEYENAFNERDKTQNVNYSREYVHHFTEGSYIPGIEVEYNIMSSLAPQVPVETINEYIQGLIGDENIVITLTAPEKNDIVLPNKEKLLTWFIESKNENIEPIKEDENNLSLLKELPEGGLIVSESIDPIFGTTNYILSNGVKVIIKPTKWKDDEILMSAIGQGGSSLFPEKEYTNIKLYSLLSNIGGLGDFNQAQLSKVLAGKRVSVQPTIELIYQGLSGYSSIKDFETMLQLIYLNFTSPRTDEEAYKSYIGRLKSQLENQDANPETAFVDTLMKEAYVNKMRYSRLKASDLNQANYEMIMQWRKERYANAGNFTFVFTGNIDPTTSRDEIAKYLGALPSQNKKETFNPIKTGLVPGINKNSFEQPMENIKAIVIDIYWTILDPDMKNKVSVDMFQQILNIVLMEKVREDEGGTYNVNASSYISDYPKGNTPLQIYFETQPGKEIHLNSIVHREIKNIAENGPRIEDFNKIKEYILKRQSEREEENSYWNSTITEYYQRGYNGYSNYTEMVNNMTPSDIQKTAQSFIDSNNLIEVIMKGIK